MDNACSSCGAYAHVVLKCLDKVIRAFISCFVAYENYEKKFHAFILNITREEENFNIFYFIKACKNIM